MSLHDVAIPNNTPPAVIAFSLAILVVCFVAFSIVYLCKYCFSTVINTWSFHRTSSGSIVRLSPTISPPRGLDPSLLQIYPTFPYSSVKDLHKENYGLECAICLLEFEDHSLLRLLTLCCHVFHQDCIDLWLRSHKTCPVCRRDLDSPSYEMHKTGDVVNHIGDDDVVANIVSLINDEICIDVREGEEGDKGDANVGDKRHQHQHQHQHQHEHDCDHPVSTSVSVQQQEEQMFSRSHSTGHSIVLIREDEGKDIDDDKYTLRLPEHAIRGRHNCTRSCASYKEMARLVAPCSSCGFVQHISGCSSLSHAQKS